jgi:hypothetical protein
MIGQPISRYGIIENFGGGGIGAQFIRMRSSFVTTSVPSTLHPYDERDMVSVEDQAKH